MALRLRLTGTFVVRTDSPDDAARAALPRLLIGTLRGPVRHDRFVMFSFNDCWKPPPTVLLDARNGIACAATAGRANI